MKTLLIFSVMAMMTACQNNTQQTSSTNADSSAEKKQLPVAALDGRYAGSSIAADSLRHVHSLQPVFENDKRMASAYCTLSFEMVYLPKSRYAKTINNSGPVFNDSILAVLKNVSAGDSIVFRKIAFMDNDNFRCSSKALVIGVQ